jgi:hypothetical protein
MTQSGRGRIATAGRGRNLPSHAMADHQCQPPSPQGSCGSTSLDLHETPFLRGLFPLQKPGEYRQSAFDICMLYFAEKQKKKGASGPVAVEFLEPDLISTKITGGRATPRSAPTTQGTRVASVAVPSVSQRSRVSQACVRCRRQKLKARFSLDSL